MKVHHDSSDKSVFIGRSNSMSRFLCFKLLDMEIDPGTVTDKVVYYPPKRNQMGKCSSERERKIDSRDEKGSGRQGLTRAVKAVLFYTKLRRRDQESKIVSKAMRRDSSNSSFLFTTKRCHSHDFEARTGLAKSSSTRSTSSSISSSSTSSSLSLQNPETCTRVSSSIQNPKPPKQLSSKKQINLEEGSPGSVIMGFLLILITLTFTILWGKVWAIALNVIWLYLIPQNGSSGRREKSVEVAARSESSGEQRRRVIMEGLLDRKHSSHHQTRQQR
uniref:Uncharacterized protein n=1 Tax=Kalanchoe fedtschenkoi TaxID=63787 RepID=A0A7N0TJV8_KALFE